MHSNPGEKTLTRLGSFIVSKPLCVEKDGIFYIAREKNESADKKPKMNTIRRP